MPESPKFGSPGRPSDEDELDGVVLFDPTAEPRYPPPPSSRSGRWVLALGLPVLIAAGAYGIYEIRASSLPPDELSLPLPVVTAGDSNAVATLEGLTREDASGLAGSSVVLAVRALGPTRAAMFDSLIHFQVTSGDGVLLADTGRTNAQGVARAELLLPERVGIVEVTAGLGGSDLQTRLSVTVLPGAVERVAIHSGDRQVTEVGDLLADRVTVLVTDADGNPVPGVEVAFTTADEGLLGPSRPRTDSLGLASAMWRLGPDPGSQRAVATVEEIQATVTFSATATARPVEVESRPAPVESGPVTVVPRDFVIGGSHVCSLGGGVANCRGANDRGQRAARTVGLTAIATGVSHLCGLNAVGDAVCWGANEGGQLGDGTRTDRSSPVVVRTELKFSTLTAGASHTCGLAGGGVPICWGQNLNGQLGDGSRTDQWAPITVGGGLFFTTLVAGRDHTCGLTDNGNAFCWGLNSEGQLGDDSRLDRLVPTLVRASLESLAAGATHTCALSRGQVLCWGGNRFGQLGDGTVEGRAAPAPVVDLPGTPVQVVAGQVHTCALDADGSAYCWGQNLHGQLGNGSTDTALRPTAVTGGITFRSIHAGGALTCGFSTDGSQYCWGLNQSGQLGDGTRESRSTPTLIR